MADEVAEQAERGVLGLGSGPDPRAQDIGAAGRVEHGDDPRVPEAGEAHGDRQWLDEEQDDACSDERDDVRDGRKRPQPCALAQARTVHRRPPIDGRRLGQRGVRRGALHHPPLIGSRRITRSASIGSSLTCSAWPSPVETIAK